MTRRWSGQLAKSAGVSKDEFLTDYPELEELDILAVLAYAAHRIADERVVDVGVGLAVENALRDSGQKARIVREILK